jgi:hypothetical protein
MKKFFALSLFALSFTTAYAGSFDLVLVTDQGSKNVKRFDGTTGAYLGAFGSGFFTNPQGITIQGGIAHVMDVVSNSARIRKFNFSTGEYLGSVSVQSWSFSAGGSNLIIGTDNNYYITASGQGGTTRTSMTTGVQVATRLATVERGIAQGQDGRIYVNAIDSRLYSDIGGFSGFGSWGSNVAAPINDPYQMVLVGGTRLASANAGNDSVTSFTTGGSSLASFSVDSLLDDPRALGLGHNNVLYAGGFVAGSTTNGQIVRLDAFTGDNLGVFGSGILQNPHSMAVQMAPEPGTMIAIAAGIGLLAKRRRRS